MAIKGSATIELVNADGSKEIIKHDNMITNAVNELLKSQRGDIATLFKIVQNNESYAQAIFGGLLLFGEQLNTDPEDYLLPSINIVGYASQDAYAGLDVARGSFNASEGGVQADGSYKFVWDFATSQANGVIRSLALCPNMMGKIGASDTIVNDELAAFTIKNDVSAPFNTNGYMLIDGDTVEGISTNFFNIAAIVGDIAYAVEKYNLYYSSGSTTSSRYITVTGNLRLYKFKLGASSVSMSDHVGVARYLGYIDVPMPADFISILGKNNNYYGATYAFDHASGILRIFPCYKKSDIAINGTTKYVEIGLKDNMTTTLYTFTNNTVGKILRNGTSMGVGFLYTMYVGKNYIVNFSSITGSTTESANTSMFVTNKSDNTDVKRVKYAGGGDFKFNITTAIYFRPVFEFGNILIFAYVGDDKSSKFEYYILDMSKGLLKKTNANKMSEMNTIDIGSKVLFARTDSYLSYRPTVNPFILTTKNNLDSPVTKTASQTMKITYTLSETTESGV